ncbi:MAG: hypothetical protein KKF16_00500 [Euryarchaeota archaeon]|nr:hypothetical protein [Euryarchaeota archaeon]MBV1730050.1 hypothetical protein [Methanobacterium sp.]MBU4548348.1 hypothetical protein [Euryarchaeota archaeon]MBU4607209.1 hypothetical protein [Euryarchaeota archaeon]MBV1755851.1 hypothetical protein [Methanobacterium sp.]
MVNKVFISDCEGPLSLNDNAFELSGHFIPQGEEFFTRVSHYDDFLVEKIKKQGYHAGDTLKLIAPFLKAYGATNQKIIDFSKENVFLIPGARSTLQLVKSMMPSYIVSTSYQQYIKALCQVTGFSYENTYSTTLDLEKINIQKDSESLKQFKEEIVNGADFKAMDEIFFKKLPMMESGKLIDAVKTVGGEGKKLAVQEILEKNSSLEFMYVGDSITDVEPLRFARENDSLAVAFNGNEYAIREANIAVISPHSIVTSLLADLYYKFGTEYVLEFVDAYSANPQRALTKFQVSIPLLEEFETIFKNKDLPRLELISNDNQEELLRMSMEYRKKVRGEAIGGLG